MSELALAQAGIAALDASNWPLAISKLSEALRSRASPAWLLARSKAYVRSGGPANFELALADAELAFLVARDERGDRKLMAESQLRRAVALFKLGRLADADLAAAWSMELAVTRAPPKGLAGVVASAAAGSEAGSGSGAGGVIDAIPAGDKIPVDARGDYAMTVEALREFAAKGPGSADESAPKGPSAEGKIGSLNAGLAAVAGSDRNRAWDSALQWRMQALSAMEKLEPGAPGRKATIPKIPARPAAKKKDVTTAQKTAPTKAVEAGGTAKREDGAARLSTSYRVDHYENNNSITASIFVKKQDQEGLKVDLAENSIVLSWNAAGGSTVGTATIPLFGEIVPEKSTYRAAPMKLEFTLTKATPGKWTKLRSDDIKAVTVVFADGKTTPTLGKPTGNEEVSDLPARLNKGKAPEYAAAPAAPEAKPKPAAAPAAASAAPAYPTSSKTGPKNWDKLEGVDDAVKEDEEAQDVNFFFKQLYKNASPEQQRAMMKSFVESNGTALSTDWADVGSRTVETNPPEGVEAKKWD